MYFCYFVRSDTSPWEGLGPSYKKNPELPLPKDALIYTKFGVNWLCDSGELEDKNVKRTDREQAIRKSHFQEISGQGR